MVSAMPDWYAIPNCDWEEVLGDGEGVRPSTWGVPVVAWAIMLGTATPITINSGPHANWVAIASPDGTCRTPNGAVFRSLHQMAGWFLKHEARQAENR